MTNIFYDPEGRGFPDPSWVGGIKPFLFASLWSLGEQREVVVLSCKKFHQGVIKWKSGNKELMKPHVNAHQLDLHKHLIYVYNGSTEDKKGHIQYNFNIIRPHYPLTEETPVASVVTESRNEPSASVTKRKRT